MVNSVEWKQLGISVFLFFLFIISMLPFFYTVTPGFGKRKKKSIMDFFCDEQVRAERDRFILVMENITIKALFFFPPPLLTAIHTNCFVFTTMYDDRIAVFDPELYHMCKLCWTPLCGTEIM